MKTSLIYTALLLINLKMFPGESPRFNFINGYWTCNDVDDRNQDPETQFVEAIQRNDGSQVKERLEDLCYNFIDTKLENNQTGLHLAASAGHIEMVKLLVQFKEQQIFKEKVIKD